MTPPLFDGLPSPEFAEGGEGKSVLRVNALSFGAHRRIPDERVIAKKFSRIAKSQARLFISILDCSPVDNESGEEPREPALNQSFANTRSWPPACKS